ncbi:VOC family protein [Aestuariimicrobium ganziense]|uniref:VOC family protein n=1 Tax=Aestuariimicrobium ganziense TaxID=2773677 RepID=UPI0019443B14|nr:VOC family protein [Aestuariimicrobium ganziense]
MHRSRIGLLLVDHPTSTHDHAMTFWAGVQGLEPEPDSSDPTFTHLGKLGAVVLEGQRLGDDDQARLHLDIETDDVRAEIDRVTSLGARVISDHDTWAVMADPGGVPFCVVPIQSPELFGAEAHTWN